MKLTSTGAVVAAYAYDASGMRQVATIGTTTTRFAVDALTDEIVALTDAAGAVTKRFVRDAAGRLVAMVSGGATYTYLTNAHGDVTALVSSAGAIVARWTYDAWGVPTEYNGTGGQVALGTAGNPFLYAGYYYDTATGHYYLRARYYDPRTGRFLSMDPEPGKTTDRLSQNPYIYSQNDPVNMIDPDGRRADPGGGPNKSKPKKVISCHSPRGPKPPKGKPKTPSTDTRGLLRLGPMDQCTGCHQVRRDGPLVGARRVGGVSTCHDIPTGKGWRTPDPNSPIGPYAGLEVIKWAIILTITGGSGALGGVWRGLKHAVTLRSLGPIEVLLGNPEVYIKGGAAAAGVAEGVAADMADGDSSLDDLAAAERLPQDVAASQRPTPAPRDPLRSPTVIGPNIPQNERLASDVECLQSIGATDILTNQRQVNILGECVGINRPDLQYTLNGVRYYVEYETNPANLLQHYPRILANDPLAVFKSHHVQ